MALNFHHGIETVLVPDQAPPVRTVKSSVVGLVMTAGKGPVNTPVVLSSLRKAIATFGPYVKDGFTGPESFDAIMDNGSVTVVAINVCDPAVHKSDIEEEEVTLDARTHIGKMLKAYHTEFSVSNLAKATRKFNSSHQIATLATIIVESVAIGNTTYVHGTQQVETVTVVATVTGSGNASVTVTAAGMGNSPKTLAVAVANGDNAAAVATKIRAALAADADVSAMFNVIGGTTEVALIRKVPAANDATLNIAIATGTATGITTAATSGNTTAGVAGDYYFDTTTGIIHRQTTGNIPSGASVVIEYSYDPGFDEGTDFVHDAEAGTIYRPTTGSNILAGSTLTVDYTHVDASLVEADDIIGNQNDQAFTGIQALLSAAARVKLKPRILIAPRFTEDYDSETANAVITELNQVAKTLGARVICDAPQQGIDEAIIHGSFFTAETDRVYMHYPYDVVRDPEDATATVERPACASIAGLVAVVDNKEGFWNSPSNHVRSGILGISRDLSFGLQDSETDVGRLNAAGIATTIFNDSPPNGGFRLWGNRQTNLQFLSVQRTADMITESIAVSHVWAVDRNINVGLLEQIVQSIKAYLRILEANGALIPNPSPDSEQFNDAWADPDLNTPDSVAEGNLYVDYRFNPAFPAEHIIFRAHITRKYITSIFLKA